MLLGILPAAGLMAPGVYVQETAVGRQPIQAADCTTTGFVGITAVNSLAGAGKTMTIPADRAVGSYAEFTAAYGALPQQASGMNPDQYQRVRAFHLAVRGYFDNGGSRAWIAPARSAAAGDVRAALLRLASKPDVSVLTVPGLVAADVRTAIHDCCSATDAVGIIDGLEAPSSWNRREAVLGSPCSSPALAAFVPWLRVLDPASGKPVSQPPSGHVCGLLAKTASQRGVWKAAAGLTASLSGIAGLTTTLTSAQKDQLGPLGLNPLIPAPGGGQVVVWGGRTLADDPERKYLAVVRLRNHVRRSIIQSTGWAVFEPNNAATHAVLVQVVTDFLTGLHRRGALMGATAREAFFVKCGVGATMTSADVASGHKILELGIAPLKPAEFMIVRVRWTSAGAGT